MKNEPFVIERVYQAPVEKVWRALTDKDQMKQWYFDVASFKPEIGFEFTFTAKSDDVSYVHLCKITQAVVNKKLAYTWRYEGYEGNSEVTFELFPEEGATRLRLTHTGLESFPQDKRDFRKDSFAAGWEMIIGTSLKNFVEAAH